MSTEVPQHEKLSERLVRLEREEGKLWRLSLLFLALLGTALAASSWEKFRNIPLHLEAVPLGAVIMAVLFAVYAAGKRHEVAELRGLVRGMQESSTAPPTEAQLGQLVQAISESQRNYRELIDSFEDAIFTMSLHGVIQAANLAFAQLVEKEFPEIVGHSLEEFILEPSREYASRRLPRFLERRHWSGVVRVRMRRDPRQPRRFECILNPILKDGEVVGLSVLARDVTQQSEREALYTEMFESLQEGIYFSTPDGKLLDCNPALASMLGYDNKEEVLALAVEDLYVEAPEAAALRSGDHGLHSRRRQLAMRHKSGRHVMVLDSSRPVVDAMGGVVRYQGVLVDITGQIEVQERLRQEQEFRQRLMDSFPDLIVVVDREGRITFVSSRIREVLGYEPAMLVGQHIDVWGSPVSADGFQRAFRDLLSGKSEAEGIDYSAQHRDGSWRGLHATARAMHDATGDIVGVVASVRDVTALRQMEQQLIQSERLAAMGQMIDGFAHELNNPLTAIVGTADLLEAGASEDNARRLELLKQQARRAVAIVQNLLFFSRPPVPGGARLNLSELVQRTIALQEHSLRMNNIAVDFIPEPSLPAILGDPNQLMQVCLNLLINAEQAIREVRDRGTIRVRLGRTGERVWLSIQDDGPGITPGTVSKMFDPFYTTKRPGRGTGLGLSVSMAILKEYDGTIEAQAAPGGGAVFTVFLPLKSQAAGLVGVAAEKA